MLKKVKQIINARNLRVSIIKPDKIIFSIKSSIEGTIISIFEKAFGCGLNKR